MTTPDSALTTTWADRRTPALGGFNRTLVRLELRRLLRNRRTVIFTLVMPAALHLAFGSNPADSYGDRGLVSAYIMISMAVYGAALATTSGGAMVSTERALGWSRQLRLTPLAPAAYVVVKLVVALTLGLTSVLVVYAVGAFTGTPEMSAHLWLVTGLLAWAGSLVFAAFGLFMGYLLPTENVMQVLGPLMVVYLAAFTWVRARRQRLLMEVQPRAAGVVLGSLVLLGLLLTLAIGQEGTSTAVYVAVVSVMCLRRWWAVGFVLGLAVALELSAVLVPGWDQAGGLVFAVCTASFAMWGVQQLMYRNADLLRAREENARLAVAEERSRLARDLHDILGHSLTVITVKAELAGRLLDVDPARARCELADVERLGREALADVRQAVEGYREVTLPGELARARAALAAADIETDLPRSADEPCGELRELFAWAVREGVTNVVRHSRARHCRVLIDASSVAVVDDGVGPPSPRSPASWCCRRAPCATTSRARSGRPVRPPGRRRPGSPRTTAGSDLRAGSARSRGFGRPRTGTVQPAAGESRWLGVPAFPADRGRARVSARL